MEQKTTGNQSKYKFEINKYRFNTRWFWKLNKNYIFIMLSVAIFILFTILISVDVFKSKEKTRIQYVAENLDYLELFVSDEKTSVDRIIQKIQNEFDTNSSKFMFVMKNDKLIFIQDENTTQKYKEGEITEQENYKIIDKKLIASDLDNAYEIKLKNNDKYIVTIIKQQVDDDILTIGISTKEKYFERNYNFNLQLTHYIFYLFVFTVFFSAYSIFVYYKDISTRKEIENVKDELKQARLTIQKLDDKLIKIPRYITPRYLTGYLPKNTVIDVKKQLSAEQKNKSVQILIKITDISEEKIANIIICLERIKFESCIWCIKEKNILEIILLNRTTDVAEQYINQVLVYYKECFSDHLSNIEYKSVIL